LPIEYPTRSTKHGSKIFSEGWRLAENDTQQSSQKDRRKIRIHFFPRPEQEANKNNEEQQRTEEEEKNNTKQ
jgi:hypothetical protein